jgi:glycosyltransferase involved in cell wall biosynthesis
MVKGSVDLAIIVLVLNVGGAERHVLRMALAAKKAQRNVAVLRLVAGGGLEQILEDSDVEQIDLGKVGPFGWLRALWRTALFIRKRQPKVLYSVLSAANIFSLLAARLFGRSRVIWGIRSSKLTSPSFMPKIFLVNFLERKLSLFPDGVVFNSQSGLEYFRSKGFATKHGTVIHNGIDTGYFRFNPQARVRIRQSLGIPSEACVIGTVGRAEHNKGPDIFLEVGRRVLKKNENVYCLIVGRGWDKFVEGSEIIAPLGGLGRLVVVRETLEVREYYSAMDIFVSASRNEGTSNAILEAMSCRRVCVVTDAGDSRKIVGDPNLVSQVGDTENLTRCIEDIFGLSDEKREEIANQGCQRVLEKFSSEAEYWKLSEVLFAER